MVAVQNAGLQLCLYKCQNLMTMALVVNEVIFGMFGMKLIELS